MPSEPQEETVAELVVPPGHRSETRLDVYITQFLPNVTRTKVQRGIREGLVTVNDSVQKASYAVQPGDRIVCRILRPPPVEATPEAIPLDIIFEDEHLIVLNKPAGMVVHPAYGNRSGTLVNALLHHVGAGPISFESDDEEEPDAEEEINLSTAAAGPRFEGDPTIRPGLVHRLDKDTSGVMVIAKSDAVHAGLADQFHRRTIQRVYTAVLWGDPDEKEGRIETFLARDPKDRKRVAVVPPYAGKRAVTTYRVVEHFAHTCLAEFRLETGRTHQIRVHALYIGHPVFGDHAYGGDSDRYSGHSARHRTLYRKLLDNFRRQALHAASLGFRHPSTGEDVYLTADPPPDMQNVIDVLRLDAAPADAT